MTPLTAWLDGIGLLGPGLPDWPAAARVLSGAQPWAHAPTVLAAPQALPAAERRRTGAVVKLALAAGLEAVTHAGADAATLPAVFTSSGGDGHNSANRREAGYGDLDGHSQADRHHEGSLGDCIYRYRARLDCRWV